MKPTFLTTVVMAVAVCSGCTAQALCAKAQECDDSREDDDPAVCVAAYNRNINSLRANKEEECQHLADAILVRDACAAQLDCDDFQESDLGQKCDDEQDEVNDAFDDARSGNEFQCNSFD